MKTTKKELQEIAKINHVAAVELWQTTNSQEHYQGIHTDTITSCDEELEDMPTILDIVEYRIMDEEEYNNTVLANGCINADFEDWYGDKNAKVLVVILPA